MKIWRRRTEIDTSSKSLELNRINLSGPFEALNFIQCEIWNIKKEDNIKFIKVLIVLNFIH